ncbi:MAG TPA: fatty acid desaturase [Candidatus Limnocylindrales bacterium]|nr:fatty acid desaturase [Candidatus Limnocylindrales bacterium]
MTSIAVNDVNAGSPVDLAVVKLDPIGLRTKRIAASGTIALSTLGFAVAVWLAVAGVATVTDYVLFGVMYCVHILGTTIGFHRYLAHKAFQTSRWFEAVLLVTGSMALQGPIMFWVSTHRLHHKFSDAQGDPHSPNLNDASLRGRLRGLWWAHMPWMLSDKQARWSLFAPDIMRDRRTFFYHRTYPLWAALGLVLPAVVGFAVTGTALAALTGLVFGGLARAFLANQAAWCVGSVCHMFGTRPFRTGDRSANNWPVAILTFGEGLQNNHHAFPGAYRHGIRWWEPDLSGWLIGLLGRLGVVWHLRMPSEQSISRYRTRKG